MYAINEPQDQGLTEVITSTFTLRTLPLFSLLDSSFTHLYILRDLACELGIPVDVIDKGMTTTISFRETILVNRVYKKCP